MKTFELIVNIPKGRLFSTELVSSKTTLKYSQMLSGSHMAFTMQRQRPHMYMNDTEKIHYSYQGITFKQARSLLVRKQLAKRGRKQLLIRHMKVNNTIPQ